MEPMSRSTTDFDQHPQCLVFNWRIIANALIDSGDYIRYAD
jgi:hypothetical protein